MSEPVLVFGATGSHGGFLADEGYGIDVAAVRTRYPEVPWISFAGWASTVELG